MEKKDSKNLVNIKLAFLDLFPSLEEIDINNEGITINFQNSSFSYNLSELMKSFDEIFLPNQIPNQTIKVFLIKSDNILASGSFTIKNGEQWVTFNYENKKRTSSNLALSLIDCIKIKFTCKMDFVQSYINNEDNINNITNTELPNKKDNNILLKPSPKKIYNNSTIKKKNSSINNKEEIIEDPLDFVHTEESKISKIFENISNDLRYSEDNNVLNNTTLASHKKSHKNPLMKSDNLSEFNHLAAYSGVVGKDFRLKGDKVKNTKKISNNINQKKKINNKLYEKQKLNNNNSSKNNENIGENSNNKQKSNLKRNRSKNLIDSNNKANKKEKQNKNNINKAPQNSNNKNLNQKESSKKQKKENSPKNNIHKKEEETNEDSSNNLENIHHNLVNQISNEIKEYSNKDYEDNYNYFQNKEIDNDNINNFFQDNFSKKLEDFQLLYNNDYIKTIKQEDFSLEIELYIEKLIELISEYHLQIEEKEIEYQLLKNTYNRNIQLLNEQNKLMKKLQLILDNYKNKESKIKSINNFHIYNKKNNLIANKAEINIFNYFIFSQKIKCEKENKEKLKKILKNILNKPKHKTIISHNKKITNWIKLNIDKTETNKEKDKKRINTGKAPKSQQIDKDKGKYIKKKKNANNINNTPPKNKNKINKK